mmetsp:Transcript_33139/g.82465  ORF Transcript_33139/g.82465 Transcript_33139/m.82465 type:complete len:204 (-) Transcript_33139:1806-2417(-)
MRQLRLMCPARPSPGFGSCPSDCCALPDFIDHGALRAFRLGPVGALPRRRAGLARRACGRLWQRLAEATLDRAHERRGQRHWLRVRKLAGSGLAAARPLLDLRALTGLIHLTPGKRRDAVLLGAALVLVVVIVTQLDCVLRGDNEALVNLVDRLKCASDLWLHPLVQQLLRLNLGRDVFLPPFCVKLRRDVLVQHQVLLQGGY